MNKTTLKLIQQLLSQATWFEVFVHEAVKTSEEASKVRTGYTLENGAKALVLKSGEAFLMVVVPGHKRFDNAKLKAHLRLKSVSFATEDQVSAVTGGVQVGGAPPFGSVLGLKTYLDKSVLTNTKIIFNCADRTISVALKTADYVRIEKPELVDVT